MPAVASIFSAELSAILLAVRSIFRFRFFVSGQTFTVFCDSRAALATLEENNPGSREACVYFCWVPAHVGVEGNEIADSVARDHASQPPPQACSLPYGNLVPVVKAAVRDLWHREWETLPLLHKMQEIADRIHPWN